jgi:hypothetical protein
VRFKRSDLIAVVLLALAVWNPAISWDWIHNATPAPTTPVTRVLVICETADTTPAVADITGGATSRALRAAGKWRLWDKDSIPPYAKSLFTETSGAPWVVILHGDAATFAGPLPATESEFAALIAQQGGV